MREKANLCSQAKRKRNRYRSIGLMRGEMALFLSYQACAPQCDLRRRRSLRNFEELRCRRVSCRHLARCKLFKIGALVRVSVRRIRERGQFCRIPWSLWTPNNPRGPVRAFAQLYRRPTRNKVALPQCNLTLD